MSESSITLKLTGHQLPNTAMPGILQQALRSADDSTDPFLPPASIVVEQVYDLSQTARSGALTEHRLEIDATQVVALELDDATTIFIRADELQATLQRLDSEALPDDELDIQIIRDRSATTRGLFDSLVQKISVLTVKFDNDDIIAQAKAKALEWAKAQFIEQLKEFAGDRLAVELDKYSKIGVTWLGTKALMWAIENRLPNQPGLYRWQGDAAAADALAAYDPRQLQQDAQTGALLLFIHGTGSSTTDSFKDLQASRHDWDRLSERFGERVYAFEHRTLSQSPIENALELVRVLPVGARLNIVTHSRGGLVGDLLCLDSGDAQLAELIGRFSRTALLEDITTTELSADQHTTLTELQAADQADRTRLSELITLLSEKNITVERYVRVACPARGTRLASDNFDVFMSGFLSLVGTFFSSTIIYSALKRVVLEIVRNRTRPNLVPGIEAMLPESPMGEFLARAEPQKSLEMAVIAGDIEGGGLLKRLGVWFTDTIFFDALDNDLVVDSDSMSAGVARPASAERLAARRLFEQGPQVNHFSYFNNNSSRTALCDWLVSKDPIGLKQFEALPGVPPEPSRQQEQAEYRALARSRAGGVDADLPIVVVLPGILGSHLLASTDNERVWFDPIGLIGGGLAKMRWGQPDIQAEKLFGRFYGDLCKHLLATHRVEPFAYDWRRPLNEIGQLLGARIQALLQETTQPLRIIAHSMGGLVVRAFIAQHSEIWSELMERDGARFIMLGTPNQGSHQMVETLLGKSSTIRNLARVDLTHDLQEVLDIVGEFRGALQLLPQPGFTDTGTMQLDDYFNPEVWTDTLQAQPQTNWFGFTTTAPSAKPATDVLTEAKWLWENWGRPQTQLLQAHQGKIIYIFGRADNTACGIQQVGKRWKMLGTPHGDGSVTWKSGRIDGIGQFYHMEAGHGDLANTDEYFPALVELLQQGETRLLAANEPALRSAVASAQPTLYDTGPTPYPTPDELVRSLLGAQPKPVPAQPKPVLKVSCTATDLRHVTLPLMVGHYENDAISGAEALVDSALVKGKLTLRKHLDFYAGPIGTATIVLNAPNEQERLRGGHYSGAIVVGLGEYGKLSVASLSEAVRIGTLRYLLQIVDYQDQQSNNPNDTHEVALASLLLGYNSTTNLGINDSVNAIVRGVLAANRQFTESMKLPLRITRLELIEYYRDTALTAAHALLKLSERLNQDISRYGMRVEAAAELNQHKGTRERLAVDASQSYWLRLMVTDADQSEANPLNNNTAKRFAERLRFIFLGARARAETVVQQRQPGLVEKLVAKSITRQDYQEHFSRTLFQLLVPSDFKEAARQLDRMILVVDSYTANLPWELMLADDKPLAIQTAMVRQLSSARYRARIRSTLDTTAFVLGNPSSQGFADAFPNPALAANEQRDPDPLPGAEQEAAGVAQLLKQQHYQVVEAIGFEHTALSIINKLYQHPYRIIHIAAHGVYAVRAEDGSERSGVILSDGLLLTAAEIGQMEIVPDLVFMNCCHLGNIDRSSVAFNRLAYSVARELIEIGVRAVIVAGWAVADNAASLFAEVFYRQLIEENIPFGEAVFAARNATYDKYPTSNTWGAYQAYGDPDFVINPDPSAQATVITQRVRKMLAVDELLDELAKLRAEIARSSEDLNRRQEREVVNKVNALLEAGQARWQTLPKVHYALGRLYADLGQNYFEAAREHYLQAIETEDTEAQVPIAAIEQLANLEARHGELQHQPELVDAALDRLHQLDKLLDTEKNPHPERCGFIGSAYKRQARLLAHQLLHADDNQPADGDEFTNALSKSIKWYKKAEGDPDSPQFRPHLAVNRLSLQSVIDSQKVRRAKKTADLNLAKKCAQKARQNFQQFPNFWDAITPADVLVVSKLLDLDQHRKPSILADSALAALTTAYDEAMSSILVKPKELSSTVEHISLLQYFYRALATIVEKKELQDNAEQIAKRLGELVNHLEPGTAKRDDS